MRDIRLRPLKPVVINPGGTSRIVKLGEAIELIRGKELPCDQIVHETPLIIINEYWAIRCES